MVCDHNNGERSNREGLVVKLLTKQILAKLPPLYSQQNNPDPVVQVKFFNPGGAGTWYGIEYDGADTFFGYTTGLQEDELGYFSLSELINFRGRFGLGIERDKFFRPVPLSKVKA